MAPPLRTTAQEVKARMAAMLVRDKIAALSAAPKPRPARLKASGVHVTLSPSQIAAIKDGTVELVLTIAQLDAVHAQQGNILLMAYGPDGHLRYSLS